MEKIKKILFLIKEIFAKIVMYFLYVFYNFFCVVKVDTKPSFTYFQASVHLHKSIQLFVFVFLESIILYFTNIIVALLSAILMFILAIIITSIKLRKIKKNGTSM